MARDLSALCLNAISASSTTEVPLLLLTITGLTEPLHVVNNTEAVVSRGQTFIAWPFELGFPDEDPETLTSARLRIDNVDPAIAAELRSTTQAVSVTIEMVLASQPDIVEAGPFILDMAEIVIRRALIDITLTAEKLIEESFPGDAVVPAILPGVFQ